MPANPYADLVEKNPYEGMTTPQFKIGVEGLPSAVADVAETFHPLSQMAVGVSGEVNNAALRLKQLFNRDMQKAGDRYQFTPEEAASIAANRSLFESSPMGRLGSVVGGTAMTLPIAGPAYSAGKAAAGAVLPKALQFLAPSAGGAAAGTTAAMAQPVLSDESSGENAAKGGIAGVLGDAIFRGGARALQPITQSEPVKRLLEKNIIPTMGQAGPQWLRDIEEKAQSLPLVGRFIGGAKERGREEVNRAGLQMAMPPGTKATEVGNAGVENAKTALGQSYDDLYAGTQIGRDKTLVQELSAAVDKPIIPLSGDYKKAYDKIINRTVLDRLKPGEQFPTGEVKQQIEADLGKAIRELGPVPSGQDSSLKTALVEAREAVRRLANRGAGIDPAERATLDRAYANMKNMELAASSSAANGGVATPYQMLKASPQGTQLNQLARDAQEVMGRTVPNSGTTDRALMANFLFSKPSLIATGGAPYLGALAASPLLYSRAGQRYMMGNLLPYQGVLSQAMRSAAPYGAAGGGVLSEQ